MRTNWKAIMKLYCLNGNGPPPLGLMRTNWKAEAGTTKPKPKPKTKPHRLG